LSYFLSELLIQQAISNPPKSDRPSLAGLASVSANIQSVLTHRHLVVYTAQAFASSYHRFGCMVALVRVWYKAGCLTFCQARNIHISIPVFKK
jgi:hypothetical protein